MNIKDNLVMLKTDKTRLLISVLTFCLAIFHSYQFVSSDYNLNCLLRICIYFTGSVSIAFFGRKALFVVLIITSLVASYFNSFVNFNSFFVILLSCKLYKKTEKYLLIIYVINEIIALIIQDKEITHLLIHFITCAFFYVIYFYVNDKKLNLTDDEIKILEELREKKMLKCCDSFSKNILTQKLKQARDRNGIDTNAELLAQYNIQTYSHICPFKKS
ncbi:MAG: hypothetical protein IKT89_07675 [Clostridia bacterium]|nr:hypothetical protein [Clostridia bacterium]